MSRSGGRLGVSAAVMGSGPLPYHQQMVRSMKAPIHVFAVLTENRLDQQQTSLQCRRVLVQIESEEHGRVWNMVWRKLMMDLLGEQSFALRHSFWL